MSRSRPDKYVLGADGRTPVPTDDLVAWAKWFETGKRKVAFNELDGPVRVSTVFLGLDHSWSQDGPPIVFETLIFDGPHDGDMWRYATWDEAKAGHERVVAALKAGRDPAEETA